ncbi:MAG TPA: hypothetical protein PKV41_05230, partial [Candidatus Omnitrophota bacterium]|nr:hypothetical protein [Candidatus Omnitrophota bacterium]
KPFGLKNKGRATSANGRLAQTVTRPSRAGPLIRGFALVPTSISSLNFQGPDRQYHFPILTGVPASQQVCLYHYKYAIFTAMVPCMGQETIKRASPAHSAKTRVCAVQAF